MRTSPRSVTPAFVLAGLSLVIAVVTGIDWLGQPLRMVNLLTIIGLSMIAGVTWAQAVQRIRQERSEKVSNSKVHRGRCGLDAEESFHPTALASAD